MLVNAFHRKLHHSEEQKSVSTSNRLSVIFAALSPPVSNRVSGKSCRFICKLEAWFQFAWHSFSIVENWIFMASVSFACICGWLNRWTLQTRSINLFLCERHFHHCVYVIQPWNHTVCHFVAVRTATMLLFRLETFTTSLFKILYWLPVSNRKATIDLTMIKHWLTKSEMRKLDCFAFCINWRALSPDESLHQRHTF